MNLSIRKIANPLEGKILFDHLPKCGGTTLNVFLEAHYPKEKIFSTNGANPTESVRLFKGFPEQKRHEWCLVKGHLANELIDHADPACIKVTVLREPISRIISHYFYAKTNSNHYLYSSIHDSEMSLEDYATSNLSGELRNWYTTHFSSLSVDVAEKNPEKAIAKATEVLLERYDIIGFLDNFPSFIEQLRKRANLRYEYKDNKINVTAGRASIESIPQSTIDKIQQVNHLDVTLYRRIKDIVG